MAWKQTAGLYMATWLSNRKLARLQLIHLWFEVSPVSTSSHYMCSLGQSTDPLSTESMPSATVDSMQDRSYKSSALSGLSLMSGPWVVTTRGSRLLKQHLALAGASV